jgi:hypothetical protein
VSDLPDLEDEDWAVCAWHPVYDKPKLLKSGAENAFFGPFLYFKNDCVTKTGSGRT